MIKSWILAISIVSSLFSIAWSLVVYHRSLRYTIPEKKNLNGKGSIFQFLWHFSSITARVIALSLFASVFPQWIGPACVIHWIIMSSWVIIQNTQACNTKVCFIFKKILKLFSILSNLPFLPFSIRPIFLIFNIFPVFIFFPKFQFFFSNFNSFIQILKFVQFAICQTFFPIFNFSNF